MKLVPIKDIFNLEKGSLQSSKAVAGEYVFITAASEWKTNEIYTHDREALIFAAAASGSLGRTHYVKGKFITSDLCFILTPKNPKQYPVNLQYYYQLFNSLRKEIVAQTKKGTSKDAISKQRLEEYCIPYLDIAKQNQLAIKGKQLAIKKKAFETEVIKQQKLIIDLKQSILQDAVQGKLVPQDPNDEPASVLLEKLNHLKTLTEIKISEIPFEIPLGWQWCRLGQIGQLQRGKSKHRPRNDTRLFLDGKYPFIQTGDVARSKKTNYLISTVNNYYNDFGLAQSKMFKKGTLCITIAANIAECGFLNIDACVPDSIVCFSTEYDVIKTYIFYIILFFQKNIQAFAPATAQKNINLGILNDILVPLPPLQEQKRIVEKVKMLFQQIDELSTENNKQQKVVEQLNYSFVE